ASIPSRSSSNSGRISIRPSISAVLDGLGLPDSRGGRPPRTTPTARSANDTAFPEVRMTAALLGRVETGVERTECRRVRLPLGNEAGLLGFDSLQKTRRKTQKSS